MRRALLLLPIAALWVASCAGSPSTPDNTSTLSADPLSISLGGKTLTITATVKSPVIPGTSVVSGAVTATVDVHTSDGSTVPSNVAATEVWLVAYNTSWNGSPLEQSRTATAPVYEVTVLNGPGNWAPGAAVVVVLTLTDGSSTTNVRVNTVIQVA